MHLLTKDTALPWTLPADCSRRGSPCSVPLRFNVIQDTPRKLVWGPTCLGIGSIGWLMRPVSNLTEILVRIKNRERCKLISRQTQGGGFKVGWHNEVCSPSVSLQKSLPPPQLSSAQGGMLEAAVHAPPPPHQREGQQGGSHGLKNEAMPSLRSMFSHFVSRGAQPL